MSRLLIPLALIATLIVYVGCTGARRTPMTHSTSDANNPPPHAPAGLDTQKVRDLSLRCARGEFRDPTWEKIDASDWHGEAAAGQGLDYDAAGAHIVYWFAWMVERDLHSGFVCTESSELIEQYISAITNFKTRTPGSLSALLGQAEELHGNMLSAAGNAFTRAHYEEYQDDYNTLFGGYAAFSDQNYARVRAVLEKKYAPLMSKR